MKLPGNIMFTLAGVAALLAVASERQRHAPSSLS